MYLIDGNNVIGQRVGWHRNKPAARQRLLDELAHLASIKEERLVVVFDGPATPEIPDGSLYSGVTVYFARPESNADDRIVEIVRQRDCGELVVVTSDRNLAERVRVLGVDVMPSGSFRRRLDKTCESDR